MKVFVFDLLAYGENLDHIKDGIELPYPLSRRHFNADVALRQLEGERCTVAYPAFETLWLEVLNHPRFDEADLSALRLIQNIAQFDAQTVLDDPRWPMARPYRRLTGAPMADIGTARQAR